VVNAFATREFSRPADGWDRLRFPQNVSLEGPWVTGKWLNAEAPLETFKELMKDYDDKEVVKLSFGNSNGVFVKM